MKIDLGINLIFFCETDINLIMIVFPCASAVAAGSSGHGDDGAPRGDELILVPK